ncbi:hypothetical protein [uncultured Tateyamaria sp.]|uniref:TetR/AcrR family transcriptional regulator n=1 Tax=uncultured Tateyamaria sp. TaxID=455651 RepID=UPI00261E3CB8|nr:hypothetical protein [uncultured Tateyamaria sp.]
MARQIGYDQTKLKQDIMGVFWAQGYAETSLSDLESATGLNRRQLYNGVGDKRAMFMQALDDFIDLSGRTLLAPLEAETACISDIADLFTAFATDTTGENGRNGCMVCSTSQEDIADDAEVAARMNAFFDRIRAAHLNALTRAAARGDIGIEPPDLARKADALMGTHVALCILRRAGRPEHQLLHIAHQAVADMT